MNGIEVVTNFATELPPIYVDGGQIQQALQERGIDRKRQIRNEAFFG